MEQRDEMTMSSAGTAAPRLPRLGARRALPRALTALATPVAVLALAALVSSGVVICMLAASGASTLVPASWHGLPRWMVGPLPTLDERLTRFNFAPLVLVMSGCYVVVLALIRRLDWRLVVAAIVVLHLAFVLGPPLFSADVFGYIDWARIGARHGLDPYSHGSLALQNDVVFRYMRWRSDLGSPYGPLFTLLSYLVAPLNIQDSLWTFKIAAAASSLGSLGLVAACARRLARPALPAVALMGLNPVLLVWAVGGAHNDLIAVVAMLAGVYLALSAREAVGAGAVVCAAAIKASVGIALPFLVVGARRRGRALVGTLVAVAALGVVGVVAFGSNALGFTRTLRWQQEAVAGFSVPGKLSEWVGFDGLPAGVRVLSTAVLLAVALWMLYRTWRGFDWITATGWTTIVVLATTAWLLPWYVVWSLPFAAISDDRRLRIAAVAMAAWPVVVRVPYWL